MGFLGIFSDNFTSVPKSDDFENENISADGFKAVLHRSSARLLNV